MSNKTWEEKFVETYKDIPPAVLAMIIVDIQELLDQQKQEFKEMVEGMKKGLSEKGLDELDFDVLTDSDYMTFGYNQALKNILNKIK